MVDLLTKRKSIDWDIDADLEYSLIAAKYDLKSSSNVAVIKKSNLSPLRKT